MGASAAANRNMSLRSDTEHKALCPVSAEVDVLVSLESLLTAFVLISSVPKYDECGGNNPRSVVHSRE